MSFFSLDDRGIDDNRIVFQKHRYNVTLIVSIHILWQIFIYLSFCFDFMNINNMHAKVYLVIRRQDVKDQTITRLMFLSYR